MRSLIGFPQYILNATKLDDRYKEVNLHYKHATCIFCFLFFYLLLVCLLIFILPSLLVV